MSLQIRFQNLRQVHERRPSTLQSLRNTPTLHVCLVSVRESGAHGIFRPPCGPFYLIWLWTSRSSPFLSLSTSVRKRQDTRSPSPGVEHSDSDDYNFCLPSVWRFNGFVSLTWPVDPEDDFDPFLFVLYNLTVRPGNHPWRRFETIGTTLVLVLVQTLSSVGRRLGFITVIRDTVSRRGKLPESTESKYSLSTSGRCRRKDLTTLPRDLCLRIFTNVSTSITLWYLNFEFIFLCWTSRSYFGFKNTPLLVDIFLWLSLSLELSRE